MTVKVGDIFGKLSVVSEDILRTGPRNSRARQCSCACGKDVVVKEYSLTIGKTKSCGCGQGNKTMKTITEFVSKYVSLYGEKYDFSKSVYKGSQTQMEVTCRVHGAFNQTPASLLASSGCQQCGWKQAGSAHLTNFDEFVSLAIAKHGDKFVYDKSSYVSSTSPMKFTCSTHGLFTQFPSRHITSVNPCPKCRGRMVDSEDFISLANKVHADKGYDYSLVLYEKSKQKVEIVCPTHGSFMQTPHNHAIGKHGCPACGENGFQGSLPATLYVLSNGAVVKVGITNRLAAERVKQINRSSGKKFTLAGAFEFNIGSNAYAAEGKILQMLSTMYNGMSERFDGYSECFYCSDVDAVIDLVTGVVINE